MNLAYGDCSIIATIQVQAAAPTALLIGTDLLSPLGFQFRQQREGIWEDLLSRSVEGAVSSPESKEGEEKHHLVTTEDRPTVRNLQAIRLPPRHAKFVKVQVDDNRGFPMSLFSPADASVMEKQLQIQESVVDLGGTDSIVIMVENHSCEPVILQAGDALGTVEEVKPAIDERTGKDETGRSGQSRSDTCSRRGDTCYNLNGESPILDGNPENRSHKFDRGPTKAGRAIGGGLPRCVCTQPIGVGLHKRNLTQH